MGAPVLGNPKLKQSQLWWCRVGAGLVAGVGGGPGKGASKGQVGGTLAWASAITATILLDIGRQASYKRHVTGLHRY